MAANRLMAEKTVIHMPWWYCPGPQWAWSFSSPPPWTYIVHNLITHKHFHKLIWIYEVSQGMVCPLLEGYFPQKILSSIIKAFSSSERKTCMTVSQPPETGSTFFMKVYKYAVSHKKWLSLFLSVPVFSINSSNKPTALHESGIKCIARYLLLTEDKGIILQPSTELTLNMFMDADFARNIATTLCTTEAEFISLSMAAQELLSLHLLQRLHHQSVIHFPSDTYFCMKHTKHLSATQIFEHNALCIVLAHREGWKQHAKHTSIIFVTTFVKVTSSLSRLTCTITGMIFSKPLGPQKIQEWETPSCVISFFH